MVKGSCKVGFIEDFEAIIWKFGKIEGRYVNF